MDPLTKFKTLVAVQLELTLILQWRLVWPITFGRLTK